MIDDDMVPSSYLVSVHFNDLIWVGILHSTVHSTFFQIAPRSIYVVIE